VFMARNKDSKSGKVDWYVDSRAFIHFTNSIDCYADFVEDKSQSDLFCCVPEKNTRLEEREMFYFR